MPQPDQLVDIDLDQPRQLYFGLAALKALDRQMGEVGIAKVLEQLRSLNFATLDRTIWAGLLHAEPTLSLAVVSKRIETLVDAGGSAAPLFEAAYRGVDGSRVFGGPDRGNAKPEAVAAT